MKIKILRVANNWTQEQAAEKCNTNQKIYWSWEMGKSQPRRSSQKAIAAAYKVKIRDIFSA